MCIVGTAESAKSTAPVLKAITCSICKEIFKTKTDLRSHLGTQHSEQLTCSICGKLFISRITLRRHLRKHISSLDGLLVSLSSSNCLPNLKEMPDTTMDNNWLSTVPWPCLQNFRCDNPFQIGLLHKSLKLMHAFFLFIYTVCTSYFCEYLDLCFCNWAWLRSG